jgi:hypothetical protein
MAEMTQEQIEALLASGTGPAEPPYDPVKSMEGLKANLALYDRAPKFERGDVIRQVLGLCVQERKYAVRAYLFAKYLAEPIVVNFPMHFDLDCVIGQPDSEGELVFTVADSHRFEPYPEEDLAAVSLEAKKAIN